MKPVIGVMGPSAPRRSELLARATQVGEEVALRGGVLLTGATTGCSLAAAEGAARAGGLVIGISPEESRADQLARGLPLLPHQVILYTGFGSHGRNVLNIRSSDAVVFIGVSIGTLNEFTVAYDLGKPIAVLEADGADLYRRVVEECQKPGRPPLVVAREPKELVARLWPSVAELDR